MGDTDQTQDRRAPKAKPEATKHEATKPEPTDVTQAEPPTPTDLQLAVMRHGLLNGRERTADLQRLRQQHGETAVNHTIAAFIQNGLFDGGQVLTPRGRRLLEHYDHPSAE